MYIFLPLYPLCYFHNVFCSWTNAKYNAIKTKPIKILEFFFFFFNRTEITAEAEYKKKMNDLEIWKPGKERYKNPGKN